MFWAEKGKGAFLGDERRLRVAARRKLDEAVIATGIPFLGKAGHGQFLKELHQVSQRVAGVRRFGSAALDLAWVAAGRFDAYWERDLKPWDMARGHAAGHRGRRARSPTPTGPRAPCSRPVRS